VIRPGWRALALGLGLSCLLAACGEQEALRIGFIGGTSGRVADLGISGRNGAQLAVELANQKGGINGRRIELLTRDDEQNPEVARQRFKELVNEKVAAVVGPMTSAMAVAILPLINESQLLTISPTCTANELGGKDDYFFRVVSSTRFYAGLAAKTLFQEQGARRVAILSDQRNKSYSASWVGDFRTTFEQLGGQVVSASGFESGDEGGLGELAAEALRAGPDGVVLVANSVDAALLTQQFHKRAPSIRMTTSEWSATERYIELAGAAAEGVHLAQFFDRSSTQSSYLEFRGKYRERFGEEPGLGSVTAFDATNILLESLTRQPKMSPKEALASIRKFSGVQGEIAFDGTGDALRNAYATVVRDGQFVVFKR
jgi:branched-chain amino acid transport system substrate-binding protein